MILIRKVKALACAGVLALATMFSPAIAQNAPDEILQLVGQGRFDDARAALNSTPHAMIDRLFLEAQIFLAKGDLPNAATTYRAMLAEAPGLIPVRQALADILFRMGDFAGSRFHFERLVEIDPRADARQAYARAIANIRQKEPAGISAILTFTPSTNINRGSLNDTFTSFLGTGTIDPNGQETSGIGVTLGGNGFYKLSLGENAVLNARASLQKTFYSNDIFDQANARASLAYIVTEPKAENALTLSVSRTIRELNSDFTNFALRAQTRRALSGPNILTFGATLSNAEYDDSDATSGPTFSTDLALQSQITPSFAANFSVNATRSLPEGGNNRYSGFGLGLGGSKSWKSGWSTYVALEGGIRNYDEIFTTGSPEREDGFLALRGSVLNSTIVMRGFSPRVDCLAQRNTSNIAFYDYNVLECGLQFTRGF